MKKAHVVNKLKMMTGSYARGNVCRFLFAVTEGLDNRPWAVLTPDEGCMLTEANYLNAANYMRGVMCREPGDIAWFRFQHPEGRLGAEIESVNLTWSDAQHRYFDMSSQRASDSDVVWLRVMGLLPASRGSLLADAM